MQLLTRYPKNLQDHTLYKLNELVYILLGVNITECHEESIMNIVKETISFRDNVGECFYKSMPDAVAYGVENGPIIRIGMEFIIKFNEIAQKAAQCDNADSKVSALCTNDVSLIKSSVITFMEYFFQLY